ncbi:MAG: hypothetical protein J5I90_00575 [Caldilineales bacterium]|nr:hypothetical protein [Caldilineales bacterium]
MQQVSSRTTFLHALALVIGFTTVFTLLGASVGLLGGYILYDILPIIVRVGSIMLIVFALRVAHLQLKHWQWGILAIGAAALTFWVSRYEFDEATRIAGAVLIGLVVLSGAGWDRFVLAVLAVIAAGLSWFSSDIFNNPILKVVETVLVGAVIYVGNRTDVFDRELRMDMGGRFGGKTSYWRSALVGVIFAAGWTPCVGPILAGILLLASQTQTVIQGALLLTVYSLGLGIPFLIAGALFSRLTVYLPRFYRYLPTISIISGALLFLIGILIFTDSLAQLAQLGLFVNLEEGLTSSSGGEISLLFAFVAGIISFFSPCVLPLVPAYLGYLSGAAISASTPPANESGSAAAVGV